MEDKEFKLLMQGYLLYLLIFWLMALLMRVEGAHLDPESAWGLISGIRWLLTGIGIVALVIHLLCKEKEELKAWQQEKETFEEKTLRQKNELIMEEKRNEKRAECEKQKQIELKNQEEEKIRKKQELILKEEQELKSRSASDAVKIALNDFL